MKTNLTLLILLLICSTSILKAQSNANDNTPIVEFSTLQVIDSLTINSTSSDLIEATLYNVIGKSVKSFSFQETLTIDLSDFENGVYMLHLQVSKTASDYIVKQELAKCSLSENGAIICGEHKPKCVSCAMKQAFLSTTRLARR